MGKFVKGDIVVVPFPFSDLTQTKKRPAFVVTELKGNDLILCQITSKKSKDEYSIMVSEKDFQEGTLHQDSQIRPNKLFTADFALIQYKIGTLKQTKINVIIEKIVKIIES